MWTCHSRCFVFVVCRSVARNVTVDTDRPPPSSIVSSPVPVANGVSSSASESRRAVPHGRPKERPRSTGSQLEPLKASAVKRTPSIRLEDISTPRLQSSTNHSVAQLPAANHSIAQLPGNETDMPATKLQPTRAAPAPPVDQPHKPPQRPPPPCPVSRDTSAVTVTGSQYDGIALRSPTGPPPAPPDSRHRFYSSQVARRPADRTDVSSTATSVSSMRSKFEPARSASPSAGQLNAAQHRQTRRDTKNCPSVPAKSTVTPRPSQHLTTRTSPAPINESQC